MGFWWYFVVCFVKITGKFQKNDFNKVSSVSDWKWIASAFNGLFGLLKNYLQVKIELIHIYITILKRS